MGIIGKAMEGYVKSEYGNLWETHQCRPHAYGHTWSPGYEIPAGMLHGHAVATGMGFGAYLAAKENFITQAEAQRIYRLISDLELSLWHPILDDYDVVWASQEKMTQKRGGNLCAPVPKGQIGSCGYINDVDRDRLERELKEYKTVVNCSAFPRNGAGIDPHCADVGLEHPGTTGVAKNKQMGIEEDSDEAVEPAPVSSKLELGTWSERMEEMLSEVGDSKNSDSMRKRVGEIKAKTGKKAWDLGTLTGISAAVMSQHMDVVTVEREPK